MKVAPRERGTIIAVWNRSSVMLYLRSDGIPVNCLANALYSIFCRAQSEFAGILCRFFNGRTDVSEITYKLIAARSFQHTMR